MIKTESKKSASVAFVNSFRGNHIVYGRTFQKAPLFFYRKCEVMKK